MTMDIHQHSLRVDTTVTGHKGLDQFHQTMSPKSSPKSSPRSPASASPKTYPPTTPSPYHLEKPRAKRSFDVAFLIQPDDLSKKRQQKSKPVPTQPLSHPVQEMPKINGFPDAHLSNLLLQNGYLYEPRHTLQGLPLKQLEDHPPYNLVMEKSPFNLDSLSVIGSKSAFTKVAQPDRRQVQEKVEEKMFTPSPSPSVSSQLSGVSGGGGASPDPSYQDSLSPPSLRSPEPFVRHPAMTPYEIPREKVVGKMFPEEKKAFPSGVPKGAFPSEFPYPGLSVPNYPFPQMTAFPRQAVPMPLLAAATVLPSSLAALTLPAQNVCAKCKVSFRMTSDLVYHMRSHHKRETTANDTLRKRREEKLKCPVCNESFRERHHLTRHMTAHQDKESDREDLEDAEISEITARASASASGKKQEKAPPSK